MRDALECHWRFDSGLQSQSLLFAAVSESGKALRAEQDVGEPGAQWHAASLVIRIASAASQLNRRPQLLFEFASPQATIDQTPGQHTAGSEQDHACYASDGARLLNLMKWQPRSSYSHQNSSNPGRSRSRAKLPCAQTKMALLEHILVTLRCGLTHRTGMHKTAANTRVWPSF